MKVLIVGLGGVTAAFRNWPERIVGVALARRGHAVRAVGTLDPTRPALAARREHIDGVDVERVRPGYWPNRELAAALASGPRPDIIHLMHPRNVLAAQTTAWARRHRIPTVYTWLGPYHDEYLVADRERPLAAPPQYERLVWTRGQLLGRLPAAGGFHGARDLLRNYRLHWPLKAARHLIPCSRFEAEEMRRLGLTQPQTVVPLWIDLDAVRTQAEEPPAVTASRPWLLFVGQLTPRKGFDLAIRALPAVLRSHPTASLLIVSGINPAARAEVDRMAAALGVAGHVYFLGRVDDAVLVSLFRACDVYLTPSRYEGFGLTLLEAMAARAPIVATDIPVVTEIVRDGENCVLARPEDPDSIAAGALRLLGDPDLRGRVRDAGVRTCEDQYDPQRLTGELESVYLQVLRGQDLCEAEYFAPQARKSDRKIAAQYGRMFALAGLKHRLPEGPALDVGCGAGPGLRYLASRGAAAYGVDQSLYALRQAASLVRVNGLVQIDATLPFPFRDASFGLVIASEVIEHLASGLAFLGECRRVLRPGGILLLTTPNLWDIRRVAAPLLGRPWSGDTDPTHINLYTPSRLRRELLECGFERPRVRTGLKPMFWLPPHRDPHAIPYPPLIGNGIVATGLR